MVGNVRRFARWIRRCCIRWITAELAAMLEQAHWVEEHGGVALGPVMPMPWRVVHWYRKLRDEEVAWEMERIRIDRMWAW